jgi:transketolase
MDENFAVSRESSETRQDDLDEVCINAIRMLSIDAVQYANSGRPGMPMGASTMTYILRARYLNPRNPLWPVR